MPSIHKFLPSNQQDEPIYLLNGASSADSYAAVARRGNVFLGMRFCALVAGDLFGAPEKSYLFIRMRSVKSIALAKTIDQSKAPSTLIGFPEPDLPLD